MNRECESCRKAFKRIKSNQRFCSQQCARKVLFARFVQRRALELAEDADRQDPGQSSSDKEGRLG
jgi:hypothetical protein